MSLHYEQYYGLEVPRLNQLGVGGVAGMYFGSSVITTQNPLCLIIAKFEFMLVTADLVTCG